MREDQKTAFEDTLENTYFQAILFWSLKREIVIQFIPLLKLEIKQNLYFAQWITKS